MKQKEYELKVTQLKEKKRIKENEINEKLNQIGEETDNIRMEISRLQHIVYTKRLERYELKEELEKINSEYESEMKQLAEQLDVESHTPSDSVDKLCMEISEQIRELAGNANLSSKMLSFLTSIHGELFSGKLNLLKIDEKKYLSLKKTTPVVE